MADNIRRSARDRRRSLKALVPSRDFNAIPLCVIAFSALNTVRSGHNPPAVNDRTTAVLGFTEFAVVIDHFQLHHRFKLRIDTPSVTNALAALVTSASLR